jgi:hypothetical protein
MSPLKKTRWSMTLEERHCMIAEAAYFRAERRAFQGGCPLQDWLEAEREIEQSEGQPVPQLRTALVFL